MFSALAKRRKNSTRKIFGFAAPPSSHAYRECLGSVGSPGFALHFGLAQFLEKGQDYFSGDAQIGVEWLIYQEQSGRGVKLMAESHLGVLPNDPSETGVLMVGARFFGPRVATEFTWPLVSDGDELEAWTFPYVAFLFYF
jgi:hypothetical protein